MVRHINLKLFLIHTTNLLIKSYQQPVVNKNISLYSDIKLDTKNWD